jgi:hypothetical protein
MDQRLQDWPADKTLKVSARFTEASSFQNELSDSKTLADKLIQLDSTGYDVSAKGTVIKESTTFITKRFDDLSLDERDISADFVVA